MADSPRERIASGKSWEDFCDTLKSAGQTIIAEGSPEEVISQYSDFLEESSRSGGR